MRLGLSGRLIPERGALTVRAARGYARTETSVTGAPPGGGPARTRTIMAVPKRKTSRMRRGNRRAHQKIKPDTYQEDPHTGEYVRRHHVDRKTGMYRGRQVIEPKGE